MNFSQQGFRGSAYKASIYDSPLLGKPLSVSKYIAAITYWGPDIASFSCWDSGLLWLHFTREVPRTTTGCPCCSLLRVSLTPKPRPLREMGILLYSLSSVCSSPDTRGYTFHLNSPVAIVAGRSGMGSSEQLAVIMLEKADIEEKQQKPDCTLLLKKKDQAAWQWRLANLYWCFWYNIYFIIKIG